MKTTPLQDLLEIGATIEAIREMCDAMLKRIDSILKDTGEGDLLAQHNEEKS
jgi:hypothetical protein